MKKLLSALLALTLLGQTVFAVSLKDFVSTLGIGTEGVLNYGTVDTAEIDATASVSSQDSFRGTTHSTPVTSAEGGFDYKISIKMDSVLAEFNTLYATTTAVIDARGDADKDALLAQFKASALTGSFTVKVTYDANLSRGAAELVFGQEGVSSSDCIFEVVTPINYSTNPFYVNFTIKDGVTVQDLKDTPALLNNLYMTLDDVTASATNQTLPVTAQLTAGVVEIADGGEKYGEISFTTAPDTVHVRKTSNTGGGGGSLVPTPTPTATPVPPATPNASIVVDGVETKVDTTSENGKTYIDTDAIETPVKDGFAFDGWYAEPYMYTEVDGKLEITENTKLYPKFINLVAPSELIADDHFAYIVGYPDGEVKPNGKITREEVAAAFYRLLTADKKAEIEATTHSFPDVEATRWSNDSIATLAKGGYIVGDENGNFNPSAPITRAEFVAIASKFMADNTDAGINYFTDIDGHWAKAAIVKVASQSYWIFGYEDGTFRPNNNITRAEAMAIINRMLVRYGDTDSSHATDWPDVNEADWFYGPVIEATTSHDDFAREADGWNENWHPEQ